MSLFEDFINLELPRRPVMWTFGTSAYDADPNNIGAPAIIALSPAGSLFLQQTGNVLWKKNTAAAGSWEALTAGAPGTYLPLAGGTLTGTLNFSLPDGIDEITSESTLNIRQTDFINDGRDHWGIEIKAGNALAPGLKGGNIEVEGSSGGDSDGITGPGAGGDVIVQAYYGGGGLGAFPGGRGGDVFIYSGHGGLDNGAGAGPAGNIYIEANASDTSFGGQVRIKGGAGLGTGGEYAPGFPQLIGEAGTGTVWIQGGEGTGLTWGGDVAIVGGKTNTGSGGNVFLLGGYPEGFARISAGWGPASGGHLNLYSGGIGPEDPTLADPTKPQRARLSMQGAQTFTGGSVDIFGGEGPDGSTASGGSINITAGYGDDGGGSVSLYGGGSVLNGGGSISLTAGTSTNTIGGSISLTPGGGGAGDGVIFINGRMIVQTGSNARTSIGFTGRPDDFGIFDNSGYLVMQPDDASQAEVAVGIGQAQIKAAASHRVTANTTSVAFDAGLASFLLEHDPDEFAVGANGGRFTFIASDGIGGDVGTAGGAGGFYSLTAGAGGADGGAGAGGGGSFSFVAGNGGAGGVAAGGGAGGNINLSAGSGGIDGGAGAGVDGVITLNSDTHAEGKGIWIHAANGSGNSPTANLYFREPRDGSYADSVEMGFVAVGGGRYRLPAGANGGDRPPRLVVRGMSGNHDDNVTWVAQPGSDNDFYSGHGGNGGALGAGREGGFWNLNAGNGGEGSATFLAGNGGDFNIVAGNAGGDNGGGGATGGGVRIGGGTSTGLNDGGLVWLRGGDSAPVGGNGGDIDLLPGLQDNASGLDSDGRVLARSGISLQPSRTKPPATVRRRGTLWNVEGANGVADLPQIVWKDTADAYSWQNLLHEGHLIGNLVGGKIIAANVGAKNLAGMVDRVSSTLSFNNGAIEFSIAPAGGGYTSFDVWTNNTKWTKTVAQTVVLPNTVGLHFIFFDSTGTLTSSTSPWDITSDQTAPVATVFWNGSAGLIGEERHSYLRDRQLHGYLHSTRGAAYDSGLAGTFTNTTLSIATGAIYDEDIKDPITGPVTACRLWYTANAGTEMTFADNVTTPYAVNAGVLRYDNAGTLTDVTNNRYVTNWVYATNLATYPIAVVVSQAQYTNLANARAASQPNFPTFGTREWKLLYAVIYQNSGGTPTYVESTDYRNASSLPNAVVTSLPAVSVTFTPSGDIASTNVQAALEEVDAKTKDRAVVTYTVTTDATTMENTTWGTITKPAAIATVGQVIIGRVVDDGNADAVFISGVFMSWKLNAGNIQVLYVSGLELNTAYTMTVEVVNA